MAFMYDSGTDSEAVKRVMDQFEKGAFSFYQYRNLIRFPKRK